MNHNLITSVLKQNREYKDFINAVLFADSGRGKKHTINVSGLTETADRIFIACSAGDILDSGKSALILLRDDKEALSVSEYLNFLGIDSLFYPSRDYNFNNITTSHEFENDRLRVLSRIADNKDEGRPAVVCAGIAAALQITMPQELFEKLTVKIEANDTVDLAELIQKLVTGGYTKVELVEGPGQFAVRGGIIDVYPPLGTACRIELFGDEIDRIGYFDASTQRFTEFCDDEIILPPAREIVLTDETRGIVLSSIERHIDKLSKKSDGEHYARALKILNSERAQIKEGMELNSSDKYMPFIYPSGSCLVDIFDGIIIM